MTSEERVPFIRKELDSLYPETHTFLHYEKDYELLFATILSAQATDRSVNACTRVLFAEYPSLESFANAKEEDLLPLLRPVGLGKSKAHYLVSCAKVLLEKYNGRLPKDRETLVTLPGVGVKTSGVVLGELYDAPYLPVDTHVFRVSHRLGLVPDRVKTPEESEKRLEKLFLGEKSLIHRHRQLILLGRNYCMARNPHCSTCPLAPYCKYNQQNQKKTAKKD